MHDASSLAAQPSEKPPSQHQTIPTNRNAIVGRNRRRRFRRIPRGGVSRWFEWNGGFSTAKLVNRFAVMRLINLKELAETPWAVPPYECALRVIGLFRFVRPALATDSDPTHTLPQHSRCGLRPYPSYVLHLSVDHRSTRGYGRQRPASPFIPQARSMHVRDTDSTSPPQPQSSKGRSI
jgi:hypothetical protein